MSKYVRKKHDKMWLPTVKQNRKISQPNGTNNRSFLKKKKKKGKTLTNAMPEFLKQSSPRLLIVFEALPSL